MLKDDDHGVYFIRNLMRIPGEKYWKIFFKTFQMNTHVTEIYCVWKLINEIYKRVHSITFVQTHFLNQNWVASLFDDLIWWTYVNTNTLYPRKENYWHIEIRKKNWSVRDPAYNYVRSLFTTKEFEQVVIEYLNYVTNIKSKHVYGQLSQRLWQCFKQI